MEEPITLPVRKARALLEDLGVPRTNPGTLAETVADVPAASHLLPQSLGRFTLGAEIGRGGMGRVMEAQDQELDRSVAIKVVLDPTELTREELEAFVVEAQVTAQLQHPGIVPVHDIGRLPTGEVYFVMKRIEGRSLAYVLDSLAAGVPDEVDHWTTRRLLRAFIQVCETVAYAHDQGILHRDLKPGNIMLGEFGEVLVLDWGAASSARAGGTQQELTGTPAYMSPEQSRGEPLDARSDVASLGAILFKMLTLRQAFRGDDLIQIVFKLVSEDRPDARTANPDLVVPEELAEIAEIALELAPADRYQTAGELAEAIEAYLDGSAVAERAGEHLAEAREHRERFREMSKDVAQLRARIAELEQTIQPWKPLKDKSELHSTRQRLQRLLAERAMTFGDAQGACERALAHDPDNEEAREQLADAWMFRFEEAETAGNQESAAWFETRVRAYGGPAHLTKLRGDGLLTLRTDPEGAEVSAERFDTDQLVWAPVERRVLGTTPLVQVPLPMGSYRLTIRAEGKRTTTYPVHITRGYHWDSGEAPVRLLTEKQCGGLEWRYVPAGPYVRGGDPDALNPRPREVVWVDGFLVTESMVTMRQYARFLTHVKKGNADAAWERVPRQMVGLGKWNGYWHRPSAGQKYEVPKRDKDGDPWNPRWAAASITWDDAVAYTKWVSEESKVATVLPTEDQWEKAARGVDGRMFPWGNTFDPTLCHVSISRKGRPMPDAVGSCTTDVSVYGLRDLAGGSMDMINADRFDGDRKRRPVRGGSWRGDARTARLAGRMGMEHFLVGLNMGFRLVRGV
ncbi:MAG: SUMF1/EgtB/PvdO family nonheme iron enzyme [Deltaproteobacteria bacterium]|nr:SUMF1/EgtB/PvdO family nonheme iron enzyme [Deltaproteobacteria bacterium]